MAQKIRCRHLENYQVQVSTDEHSWIADEPETLNGDGLGPNPFDLLLGALGSCMLVTVYYYASQQEIPVEELWLELDGDWQGEGKDETYSVGAVLHARGELEEQQAERLRRYALRCPVHEVLSAGARVEVEIQTH